MENLTSPPGQLLQVKDAVGQLFMIYAAVWFFPPIFSKWLQCKLILGKSFQLWFLCSMYLQELVSGTV